MSFRSGLTFDDLAYASVKKSRQKAQLLINPLVQEIKKAFYTPRLESRFTY